MRVGSIDFINSLPVDLGLRNGAVASDIQMVRGVPMALNEKILRNELEISAVSALWYAEHQSRFVLLPDLSISSESGVMSVLLFSRCQLKDLAGKKIALSGKGRTTTALLEIICRLRHDFRPEFVISPQGAEGIPKGCDAILLLGNEALITHARLANKGLEIIDLAEEWRQWTKLPIVFAVWVARRDFFETHIDESLNALKTLIESKKWGFSHFAEVLSEAQRQTNLPRPVLEEYFSRLSYDFDERLKKGMRLYLDYAQKCGLLGPVGGFATLQAMAHKV